MWYVVDWWTMVVVARQLMQNVANKDEFSSGEAFKPWLTNKTKTARARSWREMSIGACAGTCAPVCVGV